MSQENSNSKLVLSILLLLFSMLLLSFASVPIYNIFCKATGFGGTTQVSKTGSMKLGTRKLKVMFDANLEDSLDWEFYPKQKEVNITTGENNLVFYISKNLSKNNIVGTAVYNVSPNKAGKYFNKIHCFCFEEQMLKSGQEVLMPVAFFIDSEFDSDPEMADVEAITLSYSFYKIREILKNP